MQVTPDGAVEEEEEAEIPEDGREKRQPTQGFAGIVKEGARLMQRPSHWRDQAA